MDDPPYQELAHRVNKAIQAAKVRLENFRPEAQLEQCQQKLTFQKSELESKAENLATQTAEFETGGVSYSTME